jgi:hypothetical protein
MGFHSLGIGGSPCLQSGSAFVWIFFVPLLRIFTESLWIFGVFFSSLLQNRIGIFFAPLALTC